MTLSKNIDSLVLDRAPQLIQDFYSLEGEGGTIGRSSLFLRTNQCNCSCNFCDTAFSITGEYKSIISDMTGEEMRQYLHNKYSQDIRKETKNLTITGGEPLLNVKHFSTMFQNIFKVFPNINKVLIETNGYLLHHREVCLKLIEQISKFTPDIKFVISMSPKLNGKISHANKVSNEHILDNYETILKNYREILDLHFDIQVKFVHSEVLVIENEQLMERNNNMFNRIPNDKILIMPFTPNDPLDKDKEFWEASKDMAANYALKNHFRYSPRIHIDRRLD